MVSLTATDARSAALGSLQLALRPNGSIECFGHRFHVRNTFVARAVHEKGRCTVDAAAYAPIEVGPDGFEVLGRLERGAKSRRIETSLGGDRGIESQAELRRVFE